jgi:hypothetical protein
VIQITNETEKIVVAAVSNPNFFMSSNTIEMKIQAVVSLIEEVEKAVNKYIFKPPYLFTFPLQEQSDEILFQLLYRRTDRFHFLHSHLVTSATP